MLLGIPFVRLEPIVVDHLLFICLCRIPGPIDPVYVNICLVSTFYVLIHVYPAVLAKHAHYCLTLFVHSRSLI